MLVYWRADVGPYPMLSILKSNEMPVLNRIMHTNSLHPDHTLGSGGVGWGTDNVHAPLHTRTAIELARYFRFSRKLCATRYKGRCGGRTNGISYIYLHHFLNLYSQCEVFLSFYFIFNLCAVQIFHQVIGRTKCVRSPSCPTC